MTQLCPDIFWNSSTHTVWHKKEVFHLSRSLTRILYILIENSNKKVSSVDIFFHVWDDYHREFDSKSIRSLISALRLKLPCLNIKNFYGGFYMLKSMHVEFPVFTEYLLEILDQAKNGITITDPLQQDNPIIYVNDAFSSLFDYTKEEVIGRNCRFLQMEDRDQKALDEVRMAIKNEVSITVTLRNYSRNGVLVFNEVSISPIFDKNNGKVRYFLGVQKDVTNLYALMNNIKKIV